MSAAVGESQKRLSNILWFNTVSDANGEHKRDSGSKLGEGHIRELATVQKAMLSWRMSATVTLLLYLSAQRCWALLERQGDDFRRLVDQ